VNLDVGESTTAGMYKTADDVYAKLVGKLAEHEFAAMSRELRANILAFYKDPKSTLPVKFQQQIDQLKGSGAR